MRVYDRFGYAHEVLGRQPIGRTHPFDQTQVVYNGFGDPVGFAFLAPFLPLIAKAAGALLPTVAGLLTSSSTPKPASAPPPRPAPVPPPQPMAPPGPMPSGAAPSPQFVVIREPAVAIPPSSISSSSQIAPTVILRPRRLRRRRAPVRLRVDRVTEQMSVPPQTAVQLRPTSMTAEPSPVEPVSPAGESRVEVSGWYPVRLGRYF